jgi:hypothetical protein
LAKGVTGKEFANRVMKRFLHKAEEVMNKHATGEDATPIFSYDHASAHDAADAVEELEKVGITQEYSSRAWLPALSPDFHRVIEHVHAIACGAFRKELLGLDKKLTMQQYKNMFEKAFRTAVTAHAVQKDIRSLIDLYEHVGAAVAAGGSGGNWPPKHML